MVCSSPQETQTTLSSRSQNFPGTLSLNLHLPNVNTAPVSINNNAIIVTKIYDVYVAKMVKTFITCLCKQIHARNKSERCTLVPIHVSIALS